MTPLSWLTGIGLSIIVLFPIRKLKPSNSDKKKFSSLLGKQTVLEYELDEIRKKLREVRRLLNYRENELNRLKNKVTKAVTKDELEGKIKKIDQVTKEATEKLKKIGPEYRIKLRKLSFLDELDVSLLKVLYPGKRLTSKDIKNGIKTKKTDRTIRRHCNRLAEIGILKKEKGKRRKNIYSLSEKGKSIYVDHFEGNLLELGPMV